MVDLELISRKVDQLELDFGEHSSSINKLTIAVDNLTAVLNQGKGAIKLLIWLLAITSGLASIVTWITSHLTFRG